MESLLAFLFCAVACVLAADNFEDCGSRVKVTSVKVNYKDKCELRQDGNDIVHIDLETTESMEGPLFLTFTPYVDGSPLEGAIEDQQACGTGSPFETCPVAKGKSFELGYYISVLRGLPEGTKKLDLKWQLHSPSVEDHLCVTVPCVIV